jgi:hypothetical protein
MLFEGADLKRELLQSIAPTFFADINGILIEHLEALRHDFRRAASTTLPRDVI